MFDEGVSPNICSIMGGENSSQLRMIFILSHPSVKYIHHKSYPILSPPNPNPIQSLLSLYLLHTVPHTILYRSPIVLQSSYPPLISHSIISPNIYPYTTLYIPKNTHHTQYMSILKASFLS